MYYNSDTPACCDCRLSALRSSKAGANKANHMPERGVIYQRPLGWPRKHKACMDCHPGVPQQVRGVYCGLTATQMASRIK